MRRSGGGGGGGHRGSHTERTVSWFSYTFISVFSRSFAGASRLSPGARGCGGCGGAGSGGGSGTAQKWGSRGSGTAPKGGSRGSVPQFTTQSFTAASAPSTRCCCLCTAASVVQSTLHSCTAPSALSTQRRCNTPVPSLLPLVTPLFIYCVACVFVSSVLFVFTPFVSRRSAWCGCVHQPPVVCGFVGAEEQALRLDRLKLAQHCLHSILGPSTAGFGAACCSGVDFGGWRCCHVFGVSVVLWDTPKPVSFVGLLGGDTLWRLIPEVAPARGGWVPLVAHVYTFPEASTPERGGSGGFGTAPRGGGGVPEQP